MVITNVSCIHPDERNSSDPNGLTVARSFVALLRNGRTQSEENKNDDDDDDDDDGSTNTSGNKESKHSNTRLAMKIRPSGAHAERRNGAIFLPLEITQQTATC